MRTANATEIFYTSKYFSVDEERVHIKRIVKRRGKPVIFLHGSIENGRIFYTENGKGLAPFLAEKELDCYVLDLPGRGLSTPAINRHAQHDLVFYIEKVIPAALDFVRDCSGTAEIAVVAHSWGGIIALSAIAVKRLEGISCIVLFGSKRHISVTSLKKVIMIDLLWRWIGKVLAAIYRYYPAKRFRMGSDNETAASFAQTDQWVREKEWCYFKDNLDIRAILQAMSLPPILSLTGSKDDVLGHPQDVLALLTETGQSARNRFILVFFQG
jgi:pimeloyl-ACP methyl ester carboxylesterase